MVGKIASAVVLALATGTWTAMVQAEPAAMVQAEPAPLTFNVACGQTAKLREALKTEAGEQLVRIVLNPGRSSAPCVYELGSTLATPHQGAWGTKRFYELVGNGSVIRPTEKAAAKKRPMSALLNVWESKMSVEGITFTGSPSRGIRVRARAELITRQGTRITDNAGGGLAVESTGRAELLDDTTISGNTTTDTLHSEGGAGILATGTLIMRDHSQVTGNTARGWFYVDGGKTHYDGGQGGGIKGSGTIILEGYSQVSGNTAQASTAPGQGSVEQGRLRYDAPGSGGGIFYSGGLRGSDGVSDTTLTIKDHATIRGNRAIGARNNTVGGWGGGIWVHDARGEGSDYVYKPTITGQATVSNNTPENCRNMDGDTGPATAPGCSA